MKRPILLLCAALTVSTTQGFAQGIAQAIIAPEKAVATVNQALEGSWLLQLRLPGQPSGQAPFLNVVTFHPDGTVTGSAADGTQSTAHGMWVRVGDRKFLQTMFAFNFDAARALTTIVKVRINVLVSLDGQTMKGTTEVVVLSPAGTIVATIPGGSYTGVRLFPEIPGDFYDFQKLQ